MLRIRHSLLVVTLLASLFIVSCSEEEETETDLVEPKIEFGTGSGFVSANTSLANEDTFEIQVVAENGTYDLDKFTFLRGTSSTPSLKDNPYLLEVNGFEGGSYADNPVTLLGNDAKGFTTKWKIVVPSEGTNHTYTFKVVDSEGNEVSKTLTITSN